MQTSLNWWKNAVRFIPQGQRQSWCVSCKLYFSFILYPLTGIDPNSQSWDWLVSNMPSGPTHRAHRAYLHRFLQPSEVGRFSVIQWAIIMKTLGKMLDFAKEDSQEGSSTKKSRGGKRFALLLRWMTAAMVLRVAYGYDGQCSGASCVNPFHSFKSWNSWRHRRPLRQTGRTWNWNAWGGGSSWKMVCWHLSMV